MEAIKPEALKNETARATEIHSAGHITSSHPATNAHPEIKPSEHKAKSVAPTAAHAHPDQDRSAPRKLKAASDADWIAEVSERAEGMDQKIRTFVTNNPVAAVATAVGVGFIGSLIFNKLTRGKSES